jgi:hypothetical protein
VSQSARRPPLTEMGHPIGPDTVRKELVKLGFSIDCRTGEPGDLRDHREAAHPAVRASAAANNLHIRDRNMEAAGRYLSGG